MIAKQEGQAVHTRSRSRAHGDALAAGVVISGDFTVGYLPLKVVSDIYLRHILGARCTQRFDSVGVAIVHETRCGCAVDAHQAVLGIVREIIHHHLLQGNFVVGDPPGVHVVVELHAQLGGVGWRGDAPTLLHPGGVQRSCRSRDDILVTERRIAVGVVIGADDPAAVVILFTCRAQGITRL